MKMLKHKGYDIIHVTWPLRYCSMPLYLLRISSPCISPPTALPLSSV
jgi:hypothetical protein